MRLLKRFASIVSIVCAVAYLIFGLFLYITTGSKEHKKAITLLRVAKEDLKGGHQAQAPAPTVDEEAQNYARNFDNHTE
jgi:hypothetical protein